MGPNGYTYVFSPPNLALETMQRRPTSFDIAALAGVSQPTVSRALNNSPSVSAETRARVLAAAGVLTIVPGAIVIWFVRHYIAKGFAMGRV